MSDDATQRKLLRVLHDTDFGAEGGYSVHARMLAARVRFAVLGVV
jgi:hypothetical protein